MLKGKNASIVVFFLALAFIVAPVNSTILFKTSYFDNNTQLKWKIYFIPTCPKYVNFGYCEGFTTFSRDIWVIGNQTYDEAMEICKHEVCHNIFWTKNINWQENFCERYSSTLQTITRAYDLCKILLGDYR